MKTFKFLTLASLMSVPLITFFVSPVSARTRTLTYDTSATYGGVHRCGSREANEMEARNAARRKVNELNSRGAGEFQYRLRNYQPYNVSTRRWEEKDRLGFSKGRKCQTSMRVRVVVDRRSVEW